MGKASNKTGRKEKRTLILEALHDCLLDKPYHLTSIKEIARRAGINHGLLHYYFKNKEDILLHYIDYMFEKFYALFLERFQTQFTPLAEADENMDEKLSWILEEVALNRDSAKIFTEIWALAVYNPTIKKKLQHLYLNWKDHVMAVIQSCFDDHRDAEKAGMTLIAFCEGMSLLSIFFPRGKLQTNIDYSRLISSFGPN